jgi:hypothetical protein
MPGLSPLIGLSPRLFGATPGGSEARKTLLDVGSVRSDGDSARERLLVFNAPDAPLRSSTARAAHALKFFLTDCVAVRR